MKNNQNWTKLHQIQGYDKITIAYEINQDDNHRLAIYDGGEVKVSLETQPKMDISNPEIIHFINQAMTYARLGGYVNGFTKITEIDVNFAPMTTGQLRELQRVLRDIFNKLRYVGTMLGRQISDISSEIDERLRKQEEAEND